MAADNSNPSYRHGHSAKSGKSDTYRCWRSMMQRCYRVKEKSFPRYGGRGITVCDRWHDFANFLADMGERPNGKELDRIDNSNGYGPENCRWATRTQQVRNRDITRIIECNGIKRPLAEWCDILGMNYKMLQRRLNIGWLPEKAFTTPKLSIHEVSRLGHLRQKATKQP